MDTIEDDIAENMELHIRRGKVILCYRDKRYHIMLCDSTPSLPETIDVYVEKEDGTVEENATYIDEEEAKADMRRMREDAEEQRPKLTTTTSINVKDFEVAAGEWLDDGNVQFLIRLPSHRTAQIQRLFQRLAQFQG